MPVYNVMNSCQPNTSALEIVGLVKSLKNSEQFIIILYIEADTAILYVIYVFISIDMNCGPIN